MHLFRNRQEAGEQLAQALQALKGRPDVIVLALPRGGVPIGLEVARALRAPLDVLIVRKLALPWHPEAAVGALASGGVEVLQQGTLRRLGMTREDLAGVIEDQRREVERREQAYRLHTGPPDVAGKIVVLVDDGLATGSTMEAAVEAVRKLGPARIVVAVPVGPEGTCAELADHADVLCLHKPYPFFAIGGFYQDFRQLSDSEVLRLLAQSPVP